MLGVELVGELKPVGLEDGVYGSIDWLNFIFSFYIIKCRIDSLIPADKQSIMIFLLIAKNDILI